MQLQVYKIKPYLSFFSAKWALEEFGINHGYISQILQERSFSVLFLMVFVRRTIFFAGLKQDHKIIREKNHVVLALHFPKVQILSFQAQHRAECPLHSRTDNNKHFVWREFWFNETFCHEVANPTKLLDFLPGSRRVKVSPELFWPSVTCHKLLLQIVNCFLWLLIERNDENLCLVQMQVWRDFSLIELTMWHRRWGSI